MTYKGIDIVTTIWAISGKVYHYYDSIMCAPGETHLAKEYIDKMLYVKEFNTKLEDILNEDN